MSPAVACVDVGSTFTKGALVDVDTGELLATASHPTTLHSDVLDGVEAVREALGPHEEVRACSSAGGGLRLAVVGYERAVTAEAGHRVALSAGARVEHVAAGALDEAGVRALSQSRPDVVLLVGGTDGGNADVLLGNARALAAAALDVPIVLAGNVAVRDKAERVLRRGARRVFSTANVLPEIGALDPQPAREAIREVFVRHVIGGKQLSRRPDEFAALVRAATPDAVLLGVEVLADAVGDVLVVDVGGATTDVYSALTPCGEDAGRRREVVAPMWASRTVEGDLGVRWNAPGIVAAAVAERLVEPAERARLERAAARRAAEPALVPGSGEEEERGIDVQLATLAAVVAVRRHARPSLTSYDAGPGAPSVRTGGRDLRPVTALVGSGGVLRHANAAGRASVLGAVLRDSAGGWKLPRRARAVVDVHYVLAAAGLLAADHPSAATTLAIRHLAEPTIG